MERNHRCHLQLQRSRRLAVVGIVIVTFLGLGCTTTEAALVPVVGGESTYHCHQSRTPSRSPSIRTTTWTKRHVSKSDTNNDANLKASSAQKVGQKTKHKKKGRQSDTDRQTKEERNKPQASKPTDKRKRQNFDKKVTTILQKSSISLETQLQYSRNGHAALRNVLHPQSLQKVRDVLEKLTAKQALRAWQQKVEVAADSPSLAKSCKTVRQCEDELHRLGITEQLPFLQYFNTWRSTPIVKQIAYELGPLAATLLDVPSVRLYQDSVFWKRAGDGPTPWHIDSRMAPFDTSHFITFWIPLQAVPSDGTALMFCSKSHSDYSLPYWNPVNADETPKHNKYLPEWERLEERYPSNIVDYMPMELGDLTVHSGWTLHYSNENIWDHDRMALAISFVDARAEIRQDCLSSEVKSTDGAPVLGDSEDRWSYKDWVKDIKPRTRFQHPSVPIIFPTAADNI